MLGDGCWNMADPLNNKLGGVYCTHIIVLYVEFRVGEKMFFWHR